MIKSLKQKKNPKLKKNDFLTKDASKRPLEKHPSESVQVYGESTKRDFLKDEKIRREVSRKSNFVHGRDCRHLCSVCTRKSRISIPHCVNTAYVNATKTVCSNIKTHIPHNVTDECDTSATNENRADLVHVLDDENSTHQDDDGTQQQRERSPVVETVEDDCPTTKHVNEDAIPLFYQQGGG